MDEYLDEPIRIRFEENSDSHVPQGIRGVEKLWNNLCNPCINYISRPKEEEQIQKTILIARMSMDQTVILLTGKTGSGKNQIIRYIAKLIYNNHNYNIIGINKDLEKSLTVLSDLLEIQKSGNISDNSLPEYQFLQIMKVLVLESSRPTLVVIDGSSSMALSSVEIHKFITMVVQGLAPSANGPVFVVASKNVGDLSNFCKLQISLSSLDEDQCMRLLKKVPYPLSNETLKYIQTVTGGQVSEVSNAVTLLSCYFNTQVQEDLQHIYLAIMKILTYCSPEVTSDYALMLCKKLEPSTTPNAFLIIMQQLILNNVASTVPPVSNVIVMTPFAQKILRAYFRYRDPSQPEPFILRPLLKMLLEVFTATPFGKDANHLKAVWDCSIIYDDLVRDFPETPNRIVSESTPTRMLNPDFLRLNYDRLKDVVGWKNRHTLIVGKLQAECLYYLKEYDLSLDMFSKVFEEMKETLGIGDPITILTCQWKAWILTEKLRFSELVEVHEQLVTSCKAVVNKS